MQLETRARVAAERLLLLTEAVADAVLNDSLEELPGLLDSRQSILDQLDTMSLDAAAIAILERVTCSERDLITMVQRSKGVATQEMAQLFSGMRQVRAYRNSSIGQGLQRTG